MIRYTVSMMGWSTGEFHSSWLDGWYFGRTFNYPICGIFLWGQWDCRGTSCAWPLPSPDLWYPPPEVLHWLSLGNELPLPGSCCSPNEEAALMSNCANLHFQPILRTPSEIPTYPKFWVSPTWIDFFSLVTLSAGI